MDFHFIPCRPGCGACCIVPSISSAIPGMPDGKPAGVRCIHLNDHMQCEIFHSPQRPRVCGGFKAETLVCGENRKDALRNLAWLEGITPQDDWFNEPITQ
jgi:uncharacterized protein